MTALRRRPALRWLVPVVVAVLLALGGSITGVFSAVARDGLPHRSASKLLVDVQQARVDGLSGTVDELFLRTRKRSYLGVVRAGRIEITTFRGRQGVPRIPGLGNEIRDSAHALAMLAVGPSWCRSQL